MDVSVRNGLSAEKEGQILRGAATVFAESGYEGASMSRIAAVAGVSKGTLYNYFASKRELFTAFVQTVCADRVALIFDDIADGIQPEEALRHICRRMIDVLVSHDGLLMYRMAVAEAETFPEIAAAFYTAGPQRALARMTAWIERQVGAGRLVVDDAGFAAEQLFALIQTRVVVRRRLNLTQQISCAEVERVVADGVRLFLRGYGAPAESQAGNATPAAG